MNDLADFNRYSSRKKYIQGFPEGILDVIETDYPDRYSLIIEGRTCILPLFTSEEWLDILTKSRNSFRSHTQRIDFKQKIYSHMKSS